MDNSASTHRGRTLAVLHPAFALTGVLQAVGGPLMPSIAAAHRLSDSRIGLLFFLYFAGTSLGAFLSRGNYARAIALGFFGMAACCVAVANASSQLLPLTFFLLGITVGVPMSGVSLYVGRAYPETCAPMLTILNFSWSAGALLAPIYGARVLVHHDYHTAYDLLAIVAVVAGAACVAVVRDAKEPVHLQESVSRTTTLQLILVFALAAFLQVGIENTSAAWLSTFVFRVSGSGIVQAAAATTFYWVGFLASRGVASVILLHLDARRLLQVSVAVALGAAALLAVAPSSISRDVAMFVLGVALAPIYPLVIAGFFARASHTSHTRWVLFTAGFGGSVLPWIAGWLSAHTGNLRMGILTIPAALVVMAGVLPFITIPARTAAGPRS